MSAQSLRSLLQTAVEEGVIDSWSMDGDDVVLVKDNESKTLSAAEAFTFLEGLFRQRTA